MTLDILYCHLISSLVSSVLSAPYVGHLVDLTAPCLGTLDGFLTFIIIATAAVKFFEFFCKDFSMLNQKQNH